MATTTVAADERGAYAKTLTAATVDTVNVTASAGQRASTRVRVVNLDGAAAIYFTLDGTAPTVGGAKTYELAAVAGAAQAISVDVKAVDVVVKLISSGTPKYSVSRL